MIRSELNRAVRNKFLIIGVMILAGVISYGYIEYWHFYQIAQDNPQFGYHPYYFNAYEVFLFTLLSSPFSFLAILCATVPYADSLVVDRETGYLRYTTVRSGYWSAFFSKLVVNGVIGGMAVALAMVLAFGVACLLFPLSLPPLYDLDGVKVSLYGLPHSPFATIFETRPSWYILWRIGLGFLFGSAYATLGFAISTIAKNRYLVLVVPFIVFLMGTILLDILGLYGWIPPVALIPEININSSAITMVVNYVVIYVGSIMIALLASFRNLIIDGHRVA